MTQLFTFRLESGPSLTPPEIASLDFREGPDPSNPPGSPSLDMNLDVSRPEARGVRQYLQLLDELQLHQLVREATHPSPAPTTLDHVITNVPPERSRTSVVDDDTSDHLPITVITSIPKPRRVTRT